MSEKRIFALEIEFEDNGQRPEEIRLLVDMAFDSEFLWTLGQVKLRCKEVTGFYEKRDEIQKLIEDPQTCSNVSDHAKTLVAKTRGDQR